MMSTDDLGREMIQHIIDDLAYQWGDRSVGDPDPGTISMAVFPAALAEEPD